MALLLGTSPNQVPTNGDLGKLAFMDEVDTVTNNPWMNTDISDVKPSLLLDFANSKTLDPRVTFSRASTGAYYDGSSSVVAEQNLVTYSEQFDNSGWTKTTTTVTANSLAAPDGNTTADTLTAGGANSTTLQTYTATAVAYTFSVWLYRKTGTGNVDITVDGTTWVTQSITAGWTRFSTTLTPAAGSKTAGIRIATSGDEVYAWGAQLEQRSSVTAYTSTTSSAITNYIPVLKQAAAGVPRFDHNPVTGESLGLLIEEQRTNLLTYSEQFDNATWTKNNATITANTIVAPDGTLTGDMYAATATNFSYVYKAVGTLTNGQTYTISRYVKAGSKYFCTLGLHGLTDAYFDLNSMTYSFSGTGAVSASITDVGNGWRRITATWTWGTGTNYNVYLAMASSLTSQGGLTVGDYMYVWGAQLEAGAFATSYIPTTSAQVTRSADNASMTGTNFSSWYREDQFTLYTEAIANTSNSLGFIAQIEGGVDTTRVSNLIAGTSSTAQKRINATSNTLATTVVNGATTKIANAYSYLTRDSSIDGSAVNSGSIVGYIAGTEMRIGSQIAASGYLNSTIKKLAYYPKRLSDAELQEMTL